MSSCIIVDNDADVEGRGLEPGQRGIPKEIMPSYTEQLLTSHNLPFQLSEDDEQFVTNVKSHFRDDIDQMQELVPS